MDSLPEWPEADKALEQNQPQQTASKDPIPEIPPGRPRDRNIEFGAVDEEIDAPGQLDSRRESRSHSPVPDQAGRQTTNPPAPPRSMPAVPPPAASTLGAYNWYEQNRFRPVNRTTRGQGGYRGSGRGAGRGYDGTSRTLWGRKNDDQNCELPEYFTNHDHGGDARDDEGQYGFDPAMTLQKPVDIPSKLTDLETVYYETAKYSGTGIDSDFFNIKHNMFVDTCKRFEVPEEAYDRAFPIMLKGLVLDYYVNSLANKGYSYPDLQGKIKAHFEPPTTINRYRQEWQKLSLKSTMQKNEGKSMQEALTIMTNRM
ncbi:hypothetical protein MY3296_009138 [Beauveria thailandica]